MATKTSPKSTSRGATASGARAKKKSAKTTTPAQHVVAKTGGVARTKYFTASWCPPCQLVHRMLAKHPELAAQLEIVDVDEHAAVADQYDVQSIPTFVHPDGRRETGAMSAHELRAFLEGRAS